MGKAGMEAVLGLAGLHGLIEQPPSDTMARQFDFAYMAAISEALEEMYGARGGRGMALRIGRACFSQGMERFGALAGMAHPAFRALPLETRTSIGVKALADIFTNFTDQRSFIENDDKVYRFVTDVSPMSWGRTADKPVCHALVGIIQSSMNWASGGHEFHVQEITCHATGGDRCAFQVNKKPSGQK